ncbi:hypothetical protein D3C76_1206070 [compost metagenome]
MLHVQVRQLNQGWLGRHETGAAGVEGDPGDCRQTIGAFVVQLPGAARCCLLASHGLSGLAVGPPGARLQHADLLDAFGAELAVFLLDHLDVADHGQGAALRAPAQHLPRPHQNNVRAYAGGLLVCLSLELVGRRVIDEGVAQAVAQALGEEANRPGVQVIASVINVRGHLDNGLGHIIAHL